jgi:hypothetical protein
MTMNRPGPRLWTVSLALCGLIGGSGAIACRPAPVTGSDPGAVPAPPELVDQVNRGAGLMGQFAFDAAVKVFASADASWPNRSIVRFNLAVARMNRQGDGDAAEAERLLRTLTESPEALRAQYTLGLLLLHEGREAEARSLLARAANASPPDAFACYFLGQTLLTSSPDTAIGWYRQAVQREPMLRSAAYGSFLALRRLGQEAEAAVMLSRFQSLERHPRALVAEFKYTRMGPLAEVVTLDAGDAAAPPTPEGPRFAAPAPLTDTAGAAWRRGGPPRSITVADLDADDRLDVFIAGALDGPSPNAVLLARDGGFVVDRGHALAAVEGVRAALWGDLDDDGLIDVVLCRGRGPSFWRQSAAGRWDDVTSRIGAASAGAIADGALLDADHDGDLDVMLVGDGPHQLLNNDGGWRFRPIAREAGLAGDGRPSRGIVVADLDNDRDTDLLVVKAAPPHDVFLNDRVWQYRIDPGAAALAAAPAAAMIAADLDVDGLPEVFALGERGVDRWRRQADGAWRPDRASEAGPATASLARLAIADTDGDGTFEVIATQGDAWTNTVTRDRGDAPLGWASAQFDPAAGPSIIGIGADGVPLIRRPGPGRHAFVGLALSGRDPQSDQRRSNLSGLGARVSLRVGSRWTGFETSRFDSGPGQSLQPIAVGLRGAPRADFAAITWSDGVLQTELDLTAGQLHRIGETQRQLSSCPVLFVWDGSRFQFVTDILGVGGIGFFERPGVYSAPHPRERVLLPAATLAAAGGVYRLKIAEPMEEVTYLDAASIVGYDLPPGWQMALDERKAILGETPSGRPIFFREERTAARATDDEGRDVTARVAAADREAVGPARIDARFIGRADSFAVTLTFDRPLDVGPGRPVLMVDGWVEYPYAQTVFAAWQAGAEYAAPTLEARDGRGRWVVVAREFGYPAGMPRRMALPLPALPPGTTALRLRTSQEIYWDRIAVAYEEQAPQVRRHAPALRHARLDTVGFAHRSTGPQRAPHYDDGAARPLDDTRHPRGWYTAFGDVTPLVEHEDSAVAIFGPGEGVVLEFDAPPAPPPGWSRAIVLDARGWCKDMDLYTQDGETVEPLPGRATPERARLHAHFNTRYAAGY